MCGRVVCVVCGVCGCGVCLWVCGECGVCVCGVCGGVCVCVCVCVCMFVYVCMYIYGGAERERLYGIGTYNFGGIDILKLCHLQAGHPENLLV